MLPRTPELVDILKEAAATGDLTQLKIHASPATRLTIMTVGTGVVITENGVTYEGAPIDDHLKDRVLAMVREGLDPEPWRKFVARIYANPSIASREELGLFLMNADLPITEDGCFLAYKKVTSDYKDCHTRQFDNSVGQLLTMPRDEVDDNRHNTCSRGFHFCSRSYLSCFGGSRVMVVKIDPADVVSIPTDYNFAKGRTWRYEVVAELTQANLDEIERLEGIVARPEHQGQHDFGEVETDDIDFDTEETDRPDLVESVSVDEPGAERVGVWKQAKAKATEAVANVDKRWLQRRLRRIENGELSWRALDRELGHPNSGGKYAQRIMRRKGLL